MKKTKNARLSGGRYKSTHYRDDKYLLAIGANIKRLRIAQGYSIDRLYLESGLSRSTISLLERGMVDPTLSTLKRLSDTINVTVFDLLSPKKEK